MPFVKFLRDRRGYENTYVVHTSRRRGKAHQKILYWFRTPPHLRIGRAALDEETVRRLERLHPGLQFDWDKMLDPQQHPAQEPGRPRERRRAPARSAVAAVESPPAEPAETLPEETDAASHEALAEAAGEVCEPAEPATTTIRSMEPTMTVVGRLEAAPAEDSSARDRVRHCFQQLRAVIATRVQDPVRRVALDKEIAALDPEAWNLEGDPAAAIAEYERQAGAFVRKVAGRRRRSRHRGRRRKKTAS